MTYNGQESRNIKEVLDLYREEDAGDLRRSEFNDFVESMTCLSALERKVGKVRKEMNEEFMKNVVMNEEFVTTSVMNTKIDPKILMDLFHIQS